MSKANGLAQGRQVSPRPEGIFMGLLRAHPACTGLRGTAVIIAFLNDDARRVTAGTPAIRLGACAWPRFDARGEPR